MGESRGDEIPDVAHARWRGILRLRFRSNELEREFLLGYRATARLWVRLSLLVALSTTLGFAVIDHWMLVGPRFGEADIWRFGLQLPLVLIMLGLTTERFYGRWYQPAIQVAAPLFAFGMVLMATEATAEQMPLVGARLLLDAFYFYFMLGLSFHAAFRCNLLLITAYAGAALLGAISPHVAIYQLFCLLCANLIGGAGCYALEHANRLAFLDRRRLAEVAMHDGLTGLLNRTALENQVRSLWRHAERDQLPVSVVIIDIDHFKGYNDHYGHQAGDHCLREVAETVREVVRNGALDLVARYGGEEFIAVLFGRDRAHAEGVAQDVLRSVAELRIAHVGSTTRPYVTVSVGVTTVDPAGEYSHDLAVQCADVALYAAKERGRDRWHFHRRGYPLEVPATAPELVAASAAAGGH